MGSQTSAELTSQAHNFILILTRTQTKQTESTHLRGFSKCAGFIKALKIFNQSPRIASSQIPSGSGLWSPFNKCTGNETRKEYEKRKPAVKNRLRRKLSSMRRIQIKTSLKS